MDNKQQLITLTLCALTAISLPLAAEEPPLETPLWQQAVEAGLNGSSGNSQNMSLHLGYNAARKNAEDGWKFSSAYDKAESDGVESRNQLFADLRKDWFWNDSPWFAYTQGRYDRDNFKVWDYRLAGTVGSGYEFIKNDTWYLTGRFGLGGNKTYGGTDEQATSEALLALDMTWNISQQEVLDFNTTFYPNLDESGEYRNITSFNWKMKMTETGTLAMKIGLVNEYDSIASEGSDKNDFKYNISLAWGF